MVLGDVSQGDPHVSAHNAERAVINELDTNAIRKTLFNAKGDILIALGNDDPGRLPASATEGAILVVDSTAPTGLQWVPTLGGDKLTDNTVTAAKLSSTTLDVDTALAANSDSRIPTQKAVKAYADVLIATNDAMVYKGVVNASSNPNYPAADRGHTYRISAAGKIGGASGPNVEAGDLIISTTDGTAAGDHATVGSAWTIVQTNLDGAVIGPSSAGAGQLVSFAGVTGKLVQDTGVSIDTNVNLAADSDTKISTQKAVKAYVDANANKDGWTYERLSVDFTRSVMTLADVFTGFAPAANTKYEFEVFGAVLTDAITTGFQSSMGGPTGEDWVAYKVNVAATSSTDFISHQSAFNAVHAATSGLTTPTILRIVGMCAFGATPGAGNVRMRARSEVDTSVVTMKAGAYMRWRALP